jgi:hypothetical protein
VTQAEAAAFNEPSFDGSMSSRSHATALTSRETGDEFAPESYRFRFFVRALRFPLILGFTSGLAVVKAIAPPIRSEETLIARSTNGPHSLAR